MALATATAPRISDVIAADRDVRKAQSFVDKAFALGIPLDQVSALIAAWEDVPYAFQGFARSALSPIEEDSLAGSLN